MNKSNKSAEVLEMVQSPPPRGPCRRMTAGAWSCQGPHLPRSSSWLKTVPVGSSTSMRQPRDPPSSPFWTMSWSSRECGSPTLQPVLQLLMTGDRRALRGGMAISLVLGIYASTEEARRGCGFQSPSELVLHSGSATSQLGDLGQVPSPPPRVSLDWPPLPDRNPGDGPRLWRLLVGA